MTRQEFQKAFELAKDKPLRDAVAKQRVLDISPMNFLTFHHLEKPLQLIPLVRESQTKFDACKTISFSLGWNYRLDLDVANGKNLIGDNHATLLPKHWTSANYSTHRSLTPLGSNDPTVFPNFDHFTQTFGIDLTGAQKT